MSLSKGSTGEQLSREAYKSIGPYSTKTLHKNKQDLSYISIGDPYDRTKRDKNPRWSEWSLWNTMTKLYVPRDSITTNLTKANFQHPTHPTHPTHPYIYTKYTHTPAHLYPFRPLQTALNSPQLFLRRGKYQPRFCSIKKWLSDLLENSKKQ